MRLEKGMLIKTNYSGPYRIMQIVRGCTCPLYADVLDMAEPPPQPPHLHLTLTSPDGSGKSYLGHFVEESLLSLHKTYCGFKTEPDFDRIIVMKSDIPIQTSMF